MVKASMEVRTSNTDVRTSNTLDNSQVLNLEAEMQRPPDRSDTLLEQSSSSNATGIDFHQVLYQPPVGRERSASEPPDFRQRRSDFEADTRPRYYPERPGNDAEAGLNRSGNDAEAGLDRSGNDAEMGPDRSGNDADQYRVIKYSKKFGTWLVTPNPRYAPEPSVFNSGDGWKAYGKHVETTAARALLTPLGDAGVNTAIAVTNNANTWLQAARVIPESAVGSLVGTFAANAALDKLYKPWDKIGQTAIGTAATLGITYLGGAVSKAIAAAKAAHKE